MRAFSRLGLDDSVAFSATHVQFGRVVAVVVFESLIHRRLFQRLDGFVGARCARLVSGHYRPAERGVERRTTTMGETRFERQKLCLHLGLWGALWGAAGRRQSVHFSSNWRLRRAKTRGCVSRGGLLAMVFKLTKTAEQNWRTLKGHALWAQVVQGVKFKDGLQEGQTRIAA